MEERERQEECRAWAGERKEGGKKDRRRQVERWVGGRKKKTKQSGQIRFVVEGSEQSDYSNWTDSPRERAPGS